MTRMKTLLILALAGAVGLAAGPAEARFDDRDARHECKRYARQAYNVGGFHGLTVRQTDRRRYVVNGVMEPRRGPNSAFRCVVRRGEVRRFEITRRGGQGGGDDISLGAALGAAAAVAIGAAIVGAISDDHRHDDYRASSRPHDYRRNWGRAYSPHENITCYRGARKCYFKGERYAPRWTQREFGYR